MSTRLEDYALIGDRRTAALISSTGSIDWLCWPRFDSDACFAALLGDERHGCCRLAPVDASRSSRRYRKDTMILETHHTTATGAVSVTDVMPVGTAHSAIIRVARGERGQVAMDFDFRLRFGYGRRSPWHRVTPRVVTAIAGPDLVKLSAETDLSFDGERVAARFVLGAGESVAFILQYGRSYEPEPPALDVDDCLAKTENYWRKWLRAFTKKTEWSEAIKRSLLVLQALIYQPSGGLIAAPTLGLPEVPGGAANWDYRYTWLRDSTFALSAFLNAGFKEEATAWRGWLLRAIAGDPAHIRPIYRCDGDPYMGRRKASWLPGYDDAQPIHIGNAANLQRQLDIFGEILDCAHLAAQSGIDESQPNDIRVEEAILDHLEKIWREPDQGIWESRDQPRQLTYSKVMAWVAADRFLKISAAWPEVDASRQSRIASLRDTIHAAVCRDGFDAVRNTFVSELGGSDVDGSLLRLPLVGFLPASDPRISGTIAAVEHDLIEDGLVRRSRNVGSGSIEGTFIACTFWLADCLALQGRYAEARRYFERALALRNDVGLLAEEWDASSRRLCGNFPQALSHLALINTALRLSVGTFHEKPDLG